LQTSSSLCRVVLKRGKNLLLKRSLSFVILGLIFRKIVAQAILRERICFGSVFMNTTHLHKPVDYGCRPQCSLETKWIVINKDTARFTGCHLVVTALKESGNIAEDILDKSYELFKIKHAKGLPFTFVHCWRILRVVPKWQELAMVTISHPPPIARTTPTK
jgi:hypothetical protein